MEGRGRSHTMRHETERVHTYEEALDITGSGWYHYGLLFTNSISLFAMGLDMFGFSVIVTGCTCDFQLTLMQKSTLFSMPFLAIGYFILGQSFAYDLGWLVFTQWRLLALVLAMPLGIGAISLHFFYESPKFLINAGQQALALNYMENIWRRNGGAANQFPVTKIVLNEEGNSKMEEKTLLASLWNQTIPLFKPPLLLRTLQLSYLTAVVYGVTNSFLVWFPFVAQMLVKELNSNSSEARGMCSMISRSTRVDQSRDALICTTEIDSTVVYAVLVHGVIFLAINLGLSKLSAHRKYLMVVVLTFSCATGAGALLANDNLLTFVLFFGLLFTCLCMGFVFSYFVDLYPTSYRGMAACIGVIVSRVSSLAAVNLVGSLIIPHCTVTFSASALFLLSGAIVSCFLPPDKPVKC